jgi:hypothetical protein
MFELSFSITQVLKVFGLFFVTAIAEILGCYFPYLILNQGKSHWLWVPTALSLAVFVWLLLCILRHQVVFMQPMAGFIFYCPNVVALCRSSHANALGYFRWDRCSLWCLPNYFTTARFGSLNATKYFSKTLVKC